mmetsp:Transcript_19492/g.26656  ORF Transcript_19492/g.26656 Transcript_19492/m.26656 type:complete len:284 (+) Transcript_19492:2-853(+)
MNSMSEEELTNEEKLHIAQHFLLSSPPGQFTEILADVRKIVSDEILTDSIANGIARTYNLKNSKVITLPDGNTSTISDAAEIDSTQYVDPVNASVFTVDHLLLTTASSGTTDSPGPLEEKRANLQVEIGKYVKAFYIAEPCAASAFAKDDKITLVITGEKSNLKNFWSGRWNSIWSLTCDNSIATLSGEIKIHVHYFEDGNLQLLTTQRCEPVEISFTSDGQLAGKVVEQIKSVETAVQTGLEEMYNGMNIETFKAMRRIMPITRTKMEWNINSVRMVRQVRK